MIEIATPHGIFQLPDWPDLPFSNKRFVSEHRRAHARAHEVSATCPVCEYENSQCEADVASSGELDAFGASLLVHTVHDLWDLPLTAESISAARKTLALDFGGPPRTRAPLAQGIFFAAVRDSNAETLRRLADDPRLSDRQRKDRDEKLRRLAYAQREQMRKNQHPYGIEPRVTI